jgi:hypothetical protein
MRRRTTLAVIAVAALAGNVAVSMAVGSDGDAQVACWGSLETGQSVCAGDDAELDRVLIDDYGVVRVHGTSDDASSTSMLAQPAGLEHSRRAKPVTVGVTLYAGASMSGSYIDLTFEQFDGRPCGGSSAWLGEYKLGWWGTWDGNVSSFQVRTPGCRAIGYTDSDFRGADTGAITSATASQLAKLGLNKAISSIETVRE